MSRSRRPSRTERNERRPDAVQTGGGTARVARLSAYVVPTLLCLIALLRLHRPIELAANLDAPPDAQEYAIAAQRLAKLGTCSIEIDGVVYPSRYPPFFSALVLAPFYALAPTDMLGIGLVPVYVLSVAAVMAAYAIGRRVAGVWGGAFAGGLLLLDERFVYFAQIIVTDAVVVSLILLFTWVFLRLRDGREHDRPGDAPDARGNADTVATTAVVEAGMGWWWVAGALAALAGSFRVLAFATVLPLVALALTAPRRQMLHRLAAAAVPAVAILLANAVYNQHAFGDWQRNGYQLWVAVPYDYLGLTFSPAYVPPNLAALLEVWPALLAGAAGGLVLLWRRPSGSRGLFTVLVLTAVPISLAHLVYFFVSARFHLSLVGVLSVIGGSGLALLVPGRVRNAAPWAAGVPLLLLAQHGSQVVPTLADVPARYVVARQMALTEPDAAIVTMVDPVYLEPMVTRGTRRRVIPMTREVEYASKVVTWRRVPPPLVPPPDSAFDHRAPALLAGGARDAVEFTADEAPERIEALHRQGVPLYLDLTFASPRDPAAHRMIALFESLGRPLALPNLPLVP